MKKLPTSPRSGQPRLKQQGYALIVLVALLTGAAATVAVKVINNGSSTVARDKITAAALAQAKEALIGYAITYAENHPSTPSSVQGYLPCPDTSGTAFGTEGIGEGVAEGSCGLKDVSVIGRLPWKTLRLPTLRGGDNECLWYAVSGTYKNNPPTDLMNWDTNGQLQIYASDGTLLTPADNQAVAVIIAPGSTTDTQNRSGSTASVCGGNYTASNYLDAVGTFNNAVVSVTANANSRFRLGDPSLPSSDRIAYITRQDLWNAMKRRNDFLAKLDTMTWLTARCIANFGRNNQTGTPPAPDNSNKSLPWPALLDLGAQANYSVNTNYNDRDGQLVGRVPFRVNTSRATSRNAITTPYWLLQDDGSNCPDTAAWVAIYPWWNNWKDQLFYAISQRFKPSDSATVACDNDHCLSINGSSHNNAAVVIFAGDRLSGHTRAVKSVAADYLEGNNATNINAAHPAGNEDYHTEAASGAFNDIVYCIKDDLTVVRGNTAGCP